ncbi:MAG: hypothetical protein P8I78_08305 [Flavobacterium sp.]|nr:hypothetical protein [Flavobacterium sp.]|tara:strand:+ start:8695 stop:8913 length:219 start_codon:yes stop_codon:yes gene_type:complete
MDLRSCLLECERIKAKFTDGNNKPIVLVSKVKDFNIKVVDVIPYNNSNESDDYIAVAKIQRAIDDKEGLVCY